MQSIPLKMTEMACSAASSRRRRLKRYCRVGQWRLDFVTISSIRHMHHDEPVSMVTPLGFHRPLVKPYVKFSLIRLSLNSPLTSFPFAHQHSQLQAS